MNLAAERLRADPLADDKITRILSRAGNEAELWQAVGIVNRQLGQWTHNGMLAGWRAGPDVPLHIGDALRDYLQAAQALPDWALPDTIACAEEEFFELSMMSCTLLFCASLPECYGVPDLSAVLHAAGQLEQHTDYRIRTTAAMIFPVLMRGGLCTDEGSGRAQALKVRLIHAMIRHLILRGDPAQVRGTVAPLERASRTRLHEVLYAHGWNVERDGMPCNQQELAYTLLTFHYVFLRGLRTLGIGLTPKHEEAFLHAWNVLGHLIGVERELMAHSMDQAQALFERLQRDGFAHPYQPDPRPVLAQALMDAMAHVIPIHVLKSIPVLLTRHLCGEHVSRQLGLTQQVGWLPRLIFALALAVTGAIDWLGRLFMPEFSITRMLTRVVGYHFTAKLLMSETRPLTLPAELLNQVGAWDDDRKNPRWLNALERRFSKRERR